MEIQNPIPFLKYFIFGLNFIIWVLGVSLITAGIIIRIDDALYEYTKALDMERYYTASYLCMIIGIFIMIIGFLGCLGAAIESPCLIIFYILISIICIILEISVCALVWRIPGGEMLQDELTLSIYEHVKRYATNSTSKRFLNIIQYRLECCGAYNHRDYEDLGFGNPPSCSNERTNNVNIRSCGENLRRYLEKRGGALGGISLALFLFHLFAFGFNGCLFFALHNQNEKIYRYQ